MLVAPLAAMPIELWKSVADVSEVAVRVHWVSIGELKAVARTYGKRPENETSGFSVLRLDRATGRYVCEIYLRQQPARLQDRATAFLGHEMAHCLGFSHE
jgi:hypothetical protein